MKISILGGTGKFGQHLGKLLGGDEGHDITITGSNLEKSKKIATNYGWEATTNIKATEKGDIVIFSLPISKTTEIINEVGPHASSDTLLSDITSVKQGPCEAMEKYSDEVLGMHPMYGPTNTPKGQKIILCPIKGKKWKFLKDFWKNQGAKLYITNPEKHDKIMSIVQGLIHFSELVVAETIDQTDITTEEIENFSSPVYKLITDTTARMLNQDPELYRSIQSENPENDEIRRKFKRSVEEINSIIRNEDKFKDKFKKLRKKFNTQRAQERTDKVIEFLTKEVE